VIYDSIRQYLGSQNFALAQTNVPDICVLRNISGATGIFVVLADNTKGHIYNAATLSGIRSQIADRRMFGTDSNDVLFIVISADIDRDRAIASGGINVWFVDAASRTLIIYEDQITDYYGLRMGIEQAAYGASSYSYGSGKSGSYGTDLRKQANLRNIPIVTIALIAANIIWYIVLSAMGNTQNSAFMAKMGASYAPYIFEDFQIWRLFTCMFMHFGISHLIGNMIYLGIVGYNLERVTGHIRFLLIYMLAGLGSSVVSAAYYYITDQLTLSAGASGAIYGLVGAVSYLMFRTFRRTRPTYLFWRIGVMLVFVFYSSFVRTGVDGAAHVGGFFFGLILALIFIRPKDTRNVS